MEIGPRLLRAFLLFSGIVTRILWQIDGKMKVGVFCTMMRLRKNFMALFIVLGFCVVSLLVVSKGHPQKFFRYLVFNAPYVGHSLIRRTVIVDSQEERNVISEAEDLRGYRLAKPDFTRPISPLVKGHVLPGEEDRYRRFALAATGGGLGGGASGTAAARAGALVHLIHRTFLQNEHNSREIDGGLLNDNDTPPEPFIFYLVNARTACGTVAEATAALLKANGFKAHVIVLSIQVWPLIASHIVAEYYNDDLHKWVVVDPMVDFDGSYRGPFFSVADALDDPDLREELTRRHGNQPYYSADTVSILDRRGLIRSKYYYTPRPENQMILRKNLE